MNYFQTTQKIEVGYLVIADGMDGIVVCDFDDKIALADFSDWIGIDMLSQGVMIDTKIAGLIHYEGGDKDIIFVSK